MPIDLEALGLTEMIRLREWLSEALARRFERTMAIAFSDVVGGAGSAGRPRLLDLLARAGHGGKTVITPAGGVLSSFATVDDAVGALLELQRRTLREDAVRPEEHHLPLRHGVHWGPVLSDGKLFAGDALKVCGRVAASGVAGEIRLSRKAYVELSSRYRLRCRPLAPLESEGSRRIEVVGLEWRDPATLPRAVRIEQTGERIALPEGQVITFGRLEGNDVVLALPDRTQLLRISRVRHCELRRELDELYFHPVSEQPAEVDGQRVAPGERARVVAGSVVRLAGVITLSFLADLSGSKATDEAHLQTVVVTASKDL